MFNRSYHFIPANKAKLFDRVASLGADAYIFDLEDAVAESEKASCISAMQTWLHRQPCMDSLYLRVNGHQHVLATKEKELISSFPGLGIVLPKVESCSELDEACLFYGLTTGRPLIALIESARGFTQLQDILTRGVLSAIGLGLEDFLSGSIYESSDIPKLVDHLRVSLALAAMSHGVDAIDTISIDFSGGDSFLAELQEIKATGMSAKFSIHPKQIAGINDTFSPNISLHEKTKCIFRDLPDLDEHQGYFYHQGELLSPPKIKKLHKVLNFAEHHKL